MSIVPRRFPFPPHERNERGRCLVLLRVLEIVFRCTGEGHFSSLSRAALWWLRAFLIPVPLAPQRSLMVTRSFFFAPHVYDFRPPCSMKNMCVVGEKSPRRAVMCVERVGCCFNESIMFRFGCEPLVCGKGCHVGTAWNYRPVSSKYIVRTKLQLLRRRLLVSPVE